MDLADNAEKLHALIDAQAIHSWPVPFHILMRLGAVLEGEQPLYVDSNLAPDGDDAKNFTGLVVVFTANRVAVAEATSVREVDSNGAGNPASTVDVSMWHRRQLTSVKIAEVGESSANSDAAWMADRGQVVWPYGTQVTLYYGDRDAFARLPLDANANKQVRSSFLALWPKLLGDLDRM